MYKQPDNQLESLCLKFYLEGSFVEYLTLLRLLAIKGGDEELFNLIDDNLEWFVVNVDNLTRVKQTTKLKDGRYGMNLYLDLRNKVKVFDPYLIRALAGKGLDLSVISTKEGYSDE